MSSKMAGGGEYSLPHDPPHTWLTFGGVISDEQVLTRVGMGLLEGA